MVRGLANIFANFYHVSKFSSAKTGQAGEKSRVFSRRDRVSLCRIHIFSTNSLGYGPEFEKIALSPLRPALVLLRGFACFTFVFKRVFCKTFDHAFCIGILYFAKL